MFTNPMHPRFFGFWSGNVPAVADLHFRSFLHFHEGYEYDLWIDSDSLNSFAPEVEWVRRHPRIHVRPFSLNALISKYVTHGGLDEFDRWQPIKNVARRLQRSHLLGSSWFGTHMLRPFARAYRHSSPLFAGFAVDKTYRADIARFVLPLEHYEFPSFYTDLDVCFTSDLSDLFGQTPFCYRWDEHPVANNALLYLSGRGVVERIVALADSLETYRPWILMSDENCQRLGITIFPADAFDGMWAKESPLFDDPSLFFCANDDQETIVRKVMAQSPRAIHWHNNWRTVPAATSVYQGLLNRMTIDQPVKD